MTRFVIKRDHLHFALFLVLLGFASGAGDILGPRCLGIGCTADDAPAVPPADAAPDAMPYGAPDAAAETTIDASDLDAWESMFDTCGACWRALGFSSTACAAQSAGPFAFLSDYRTCGECVVLYTVAQCMPAPNGGAP